MKKIKNENIVIAHPLQQHSYRTAEALKNKNLLHSYLTTVYYQNESLIYKIMEKVLGKDNVKRMKGRHNDIFDDYVKKYYEFLGIIYLLVIRKDKKKIIEPFLYRIMTNIFGIQVEKYCRGNDVKAIIMYDTTAYLCFRKLRKTRPDIVKILDMSSAAPPFIRSIILNEIKSNSAFSNSLQTKLKSYKKNMCKRYLNEIKSSDYFLVSSRFVEKSLYSCGVEKDKIIYIPYGVDINMFSLKEYKKKPKEEKMKFLFVGRVEAVKGIYYLFEAFNQLLHLNIELIVVGSIECSDKELESYKQNIKFIGVKNKVEMPKIFQEADVYIMPSLWEGFSLSLFEAMASGLPVIASKNSAADGTITDFEQGFVVEACSIEAIKDKVLWFYNNQDKIESMGLKARLLAEKFTWENYERNIVNEVNIVSNESKS
jgi:glycosyltransferase involved in cell wall biosynthesis